MYKIESLGHNHYLDTLKQKGCTGAWGWDSDELINLSSETCENAQTNKRTCVWNQIGLWTCHKSISIKATWPCNEILMWIKFFEM